MTALHASAPAEQERAGRAARPARPGSRRRAVQGRQLGTALAFLAPAVALLVAFRLVPMATAGVDSLRTGTLSASGGSWVGVENYALLFSDPVFLDSLATTGLFLVITVPGQVLVSLALALLLVERFPGVSLARASIFLPVAAPGAVATVVWGVAYQPQGPLNSLLTAVGLPAQPFLTSPDQALLCLVVLMSWIGIGYWTLFLLAGLQDVPRELYEAAAVDGAGWWRSLVSVTLPNLRRPLAFVIVADTVASAVAFVPVQILTDGGPANSTRLLMYDLYNNTFVLGDLNFGQAQVVVLLAVLVTVTVLQFRLLGEERSR